MLKIHLRFVIRRPLRRYTPPYLSRLLLLVRHNELEMSDLIFGADKAQQRVRRHLQGNNFDDNYLTSAFFRAFDNVLTPSYIARHNVVKFTSIQDEVQQQRDECDVTNKFLEYRERLTPRIPIFIAKDVLRRDRERQRRENHNKLERQRRTFINAKIAELGNMLPEHISRATCNRKGYILMETVEYIKQLHRDQDLLKQLERRIDYLETECRRMTERLERLEIHQITRHRDHEHTEDNFIRKETPTDYYLRKSKSTNQCIYETTNMLTPFKQSKGLNNEWDDFSSFLSNDSPIDFPSPTFSDTLCNLF